MVGVGVGVVVAGGVGCAGGVVVVVMVAGGVAVGCAGGVAVAVVVGVAVVVAVAVGVGVAVGVVVGVGVEMRSQMKAGDKVYIRTVTYHSIGRVVRLTRSWVHLDDASWVADSGRFGAALETGELSEVERTPGIVRVARGAIVDVYEWRHSLPVATR